MKGLITYFLITLAQGLLIDFNQNNETTPIVSQLKFTRRSIESHFHFISLNVTIPKNYVNPELIQFQRKIYIQNKCDYNNAYDDFNTVHHCPTIGNITAYDKIESQGRVYYVLQGCLSIVFGKPLNHSWIITDSVHINFYELMSSNFSERVAFYTPVSCMEICLELCGDKKQLDASGIKFRLNDFAVLIILIFYICGFFIFIPCEIMLRNYRDLNKVEYF